MASIVLGSNLPTVFPQDTEDEEHSESDGNGAWRSWWGLDEDQDGGAAARKKVGRKRTSDRIDAEAPVNKKQKTVEVTENPVDGLTEGEPPSSRRPIKRDQDRRLEKSCPFCPLKVRQHLDRHIIRWHKSEASTPSKAKSIAKAITQRASLTRSTRTPIGTNRLKELESMYGETWNFPEVKEKTLAVMTHLIGLWSRKTIPFRTKLESWLIRTSRKKSLMLTLEEMLPSRS